MQLNPDAAMMEVSGTVVNRAFLKDIQSSVVDNAVDLVVLKVVLEACIMNLEAARTVDAPTLTALRAIYLKKRLLSLPSQRCRRRKDKKWLRHLKSGKLSLQYS